MLTFWSRRCRSKVGLDSSAHLTNKARFAKPRRTCGSLVFSPTWREGWRTQPSGGLVGGLEHMKDGQLCSTELGHDVSLPAVHRMVL